METAIRKAWIVFGLLLWSSAAAAAEDAEAKRLAGRFERTFKNGAGSEFRVIRDVAGDQSTVTTLDDAGNIIEAHNSTFKVKQQGPVRVFSYHDLEVTAGPHKGHVEHATRSYVYRFDGKVFAEVWGLLEGDDSPPRIIYWRKVTEE